MLITISDKPFFLLSTYTLHFIFSIAQQSSHPLSFSTATQSSNCGISRLASASARRPHIRWQSMGFALRQTGSRALRQETTKWWNNGVLNSTCSKQMLFVQIRWKRYKNDFFYTLLYICYDIMRFNLTVLHTKQVTYSIVLFGLFCLATLIKLSKRNKFFRAYPIFLFRIITFSFHLNYSSNYDNLYLCY